MGLCGTTMSQVIEMIKNNLCVVVLLQAIFIAALIIAGGILFFAVRFESQYSDNILHGNYVLAKKLIERDIAVLPDRAMVFVVGETGNRCDSRIELVKVDSGLNSESINFALHYNCLMREYIKGLSSSEYEEHKLLYDSILDVIGGEPALLGAKRGQACSVETL